MVLDLGKNIAKAVHEYVSTVTSEFFMCHILRQYDSNDYRLPCKSNKAFTAPDICILSCIDIRGMCYSSGACVITKNVFLRRRVPILKIKRPWARHILIKLIPKPVRRYFISKRPLMAPITTLCPTLWLIDIRDIYCWLEPCFHTVLANYRINMNRLNGSPYILAWDGQWFNQEK